MENSNASTRETISLEIMSALLNMPRSQMGLPEQLVTITVDSVPDIGIPFPLSPGHYNLAAISRTFDSYHRSVDVVYRTSLSQVEIIEFYKTTLGERGYVEKKNEHPFPSNGFVVTNSHHEASPPPSLLLCPSSDGPAFMLGFHDIVGDSSVFLSIFLDVQSSPCNFDSRRHYGHDLAAEKLPKFPIPDNLGFRSYGGTASANEASSNAQIEGAVNLGELISSFEQHLHDTNRVPITKEVGSHIAYLEWETQSDSNNRWHGNVSIIRSNSSDSTYSLSSSVSSPGRERGGRMQRSIRPLA